MQIVIVLRQSSADVRFWHRHESFALEDIAIAIDYHQNQNRARGHCGIKDNGHRNQLVTLNYLIGAAVREREEKPTIIFFLSRAIIPREILPRDSATVLLRPQSNSMQSLPSLSLSLFPSSSLNLSCYPQARSRPLRRGSISTMIVIHVRYNRKLAAAT